MERLKKLYFWAGTLPAVTVLILVLAILLYFRILPQRLPLFYSLPWGNRELAEHWQFFVLPTSLSLITLVNLAVYHHLHQQQTFFKNILLITTIFATLILVVTFLKIIFLFT